MKFLLHIGLVSTRKSFGLRMSSTCTTMKAEFPSLISATQALEAFKKPNIKYIDGSWHLNKQLRKSQQEYVDERIPGAVFFDIDKICDTNSPLPHMLPSENDFSEKMTSLGISSDDHIIVYVKPESFTGPRVWWMFRAYGHTKVSLLNGGIESWKAAGGALESGDVTEITPATTKFNAKLNKKMVADWKSVLDAVEKGSSQIVDARSAARFMGQAPEPRAGLAGGHIPGSLNMPFNTVVQANDITTFKSIAEIHEAFNQTGVILGVRTISSCGSGVSACVLAFGAHLLGHNLESMPIYDGSWSEWGSRSDLPIVNPSKQN